MAGVVVVLPAPCIRIIRDFSVIRDIIVLLVAATVAHMVGAIIVGDPAPPLAPAWVNLIIAIVGRLSRCPCCGGAAAGQRSRKNL